MALAEAIRPGQPQPRQEVRRRGLVDTADEETDGPARAVRHRAGLRDARAPRQGIEGAFHLASLRENRGPAAGARQRARDVAASAGLHVVPRRPGLSPQPEVDAGGAAADRTRRGDVVLEKRGVRPARQRRVRASEPADAAGERGPRRSERCAAARGPHEPPRDRRLQRGVCADARRNGDARVRRRVRIAQPKLEPEERRRGGGQLGGPIEQARPSRAGEQGRGKQRAQLAQDVGERRLAGTRQGIPGGGGVRPRDRPVAGRRSPAAVTALRVRHRRHSG